MNCLRAIRATVLAAMLAGAGPALTPVPSLAQDVRAARTLRVGIVLKEVDLKPPNGEYANVRERITALVGLETRRAIYTGQPVVAADLGPPTLVRRNAVVAMLFSTGGIGIRTEGRALDSGGAGEVVRIINLASRQTVLATVIGENQVEVHR